MTDIKRCKDCKWVRRFWLSFGSYELAKCGNPLLATIAENTSPFVAVERGYKGNKCGPDGLLWEPKK